MRRCCPSVTPAGITASSVSPVTGCFICRCCPGTAPAGTATSYCSSLGVLIMAAAKIRTVDMYAFVNKHCGYIYETCDWRAGKGNVHFSCVACCPACPPRPAPRVCLCAPCALCCPLPPACPAAPCLCCLPAPVPPASPVAAGFEALAGEMAKAVKGIAAGRAP